MTAFSPSQIPVNVNTVEKLVLWASLILKANYPDATFLEESNRAELAIQVGPYEVTTNNTSSWRAIGRFGLELNTDWYAEGDIWSHAKDLGTATIPTKFTN